MRLLLTLALASQVACSARSIRDATLLDGDLLGEAGFTRFSVAPADKRALVSHMEPGKIFFYQPTTTLERVDPTYDGSRRTLPRYWYVDPYNCKCIYVGTETNYIKYKRLKIESELSKGRELAGAKDAARIQLVIGQNASSQSAITTERISDDRPSASY